MWIDLDMRYLEWVTSSAFNSYEIILWQYVGYPHIFFIDQFADRLIKLLEGPRIQSICDKLSMYDVYALARGGILGIWVV